MSSRTKPPAYARRWRNIHRVTMWAAVTLTAVVVTLEVMLLVAEVQR